MTEGDTQTVGDFLADRLTEKEFIEAVVGSVIGAVLLKELTRESRPFRFYDWCFRHIDHWNNHAHRKYIESCEGHVNQRHVIMIPGPKLTKRPKKPK